MRTAGGLHGFFLSLAAVLMATPVPVHADPPEVTWDKRIEVASGPAFRGPWRMNESEFHYVDDPTVAITAKGVVGVAWVDQMRKDVLFQIFEPDGRQRFREPVNVSKSPRIFSWLPRIVMTSPNAGEVYVLWQEIVFSGGSHGGEIFFARSTDGGRTFSAPINLSNTPAGDGKGRLTPHIWHNGSLDLVIGPEGNLYAAWSEYEGALRFSRSTDGGARFSAPLRVAGGAVAAPARAPSLAAGAGGEVYLAWTIGDNPAAAIHFARSTNRGHTFSRPRVPFKSSGHADAPKLAVDSKGAIHIVYAASPAGPLRSYHIGYSSSSDGGRTFESPRAVPGLQGAQIVSENFPALSLDGSDNLYLIWELFARGSRSPQGLGFTTSGDGGRTFAPPSVVPGSMDPALGFNGSQQGLLMRKMAVNAAGAVAIVNSTLRAGEKSHVWLFRGQLASR